MKRIEITDQNASKFFELLRLKLLLEEMNQTEGVEEIRGMFGISRLSLANLTNFPSTSVHRWHTGQYNPPLSYLEALNKLIIARNELM